MKNQTYIIRTDRAGVFFAEVTERNGSEAKLVNARRIHYWHNATDCIGISQTGVGPDSRLTVTVPEMEVLGVIEVIPCTEAADKNLREVKEWRH